MDEDLYVQTIEGIFQQYAAEVRLQKTAATACIAAGTGEEEESLALVTPDPDAVAVAPPLTDNCTLRLHAQNQA